MQLISVGPNFQCSVSPPETMQVWQLLFECDLMSLTVAEIGVKVVFFTFVV